MSQETCRKITYRFALCSSRKLLKYLDSITHRGIGNLTPFMLMFHSHFKIELNSEWQKPINYTKRCHFVKFKFLLTRCYQFFM